MNRWKWISIGTIGSLFALSHIGMIGMIAQRSNKLPALNLPIGQYTSYEVEAGEKGYRIRYNSNDPKVMLKNREVTKPAGFLGLGKSKSYLTEQSTMDGAQHHGGTVSTRSAWIDSSSKGPKGISDKTIACIKAEGGGESTGKVVGGSLGAAAAPTLSGVPFVGWVLAGAATMIGMDQGGEIGGRMARDLADCDPQMKDG